MEFFDKHYLANTFKKIGIRGIIVLPNIEHVDWISRGFDDYALLPPIIFKDDLKNEALFFDKIKKIPFKRPKVMKLTYNEFKNIKTMLFGDSAPKHKEIPSEEKLLKNLTKEQKAIAEYNEKEMLIKGVAGSGKTYALLANALDKYEKEATILFITFNKVLERKIKNDWIMHSTGNNRKNEVSIVNFHEWAHEYYFNLIGTEKPIKDENLKRKYIWNALKITARKKRVERLISQKKDNLNFIGEEFDFIKAKYLLSLKEYLKTDRTGRGGEKRLNDKDKEFIYSAFENFEKIKLEKDSCEFIDFAFKLIDHAEKLKKYDYVYVDEAQDLHQVELQLLRKIAKKGFYVAADDNQKIYKRYHVWREIGVSFTGGRVKKLHKSIRNTCEISKFAIELQKDSSQEDPVEIEFNNSYTGDEPYLIELDTPLNRDVEIAKRIKNYLEKNPKNTIGILIKHNKTGHLIKRKLKEKEIKAFFTSSNKMNFHNQILITTLYSSKGLEFDYVIIPEFEKDKETSQLYKDEEYWTKEKNLWYTAFTRAKNKLDIMYLTKYELNELIDSIGRETYNKIDLM
jgi:superfamily I DNA/RNA helicase